MRVRWAGLVLVGVLVWSGCSDEKSEASSRQACRMFRELLVDSNEDMNFADDAVERSQAVADVAKTADREDIRAAADDLARLMTNVVDAKDFDPTGPQPARRFRRACDAIDE